VEEVFYPKPQFEKYDFSPQPVSVFSGSFEIATRFKAPSNAAAGLTTVSGKLRYQACNNKECLPPKTIDLQLPVNVQ
jgi:Disulphide bond corrector protein DsbC